MSGPDLSAMPSREVSRLGGEPLRRHRGGCLEAIRIGRGDYGFCRGPWAGRGPSGRFSEEEPEARRLLGCYAAPAPVRAPEGAARAARRSPERSRSCRPRGDEPPASWSLASHHSHPVVSASSLVVQTIRPRGPSYVVDRIEIVAMRSSPLRSSTGRAHAVVDHRVVMGPESSPRVDVLGADARLTRSDGLPAGQPVGRSSIPRTSVTGQQPIARLG